jgi:hypothetical protein
MKKMIMFLMIGATVALLALPVAATDVINDSAGGVQDQCTQENKDAWYGEFTKIYKTDQAKAFDLAKKYLACPPPGEVTEAQQKIIDFLKKWSTAYEDGMRKIQFTDEMYNKKNFSKAYELGGQILAKEPDNVKVLVDLGANGYLVPTLKNDQLNAQALDYARKALQLLDAGKTPDDWSPLTGKDVAVAYLNFTIGTLTLAKEPANALKNLIKAAQFETPLKKSPYTYAYIEGAYETGAYAKQSDEYKRVYGGKDETPESKLALANINQLVERMIDAYARAIALAGNSPDYAKDKPVWEENLTNWYKYLHNGNVDGMKEMIATITTKPLPPEPTPLTSLPASTPASTPTGNTGAPTNGNGTSGTSAPTGTTTPTNKASTTTPTTKPATTTPTTKPAGTKPGTPDRPRNNH